MVVTILTNLAVLVLTIVTAVFSEFTYQEILLGGILMILITAGQLTEGYGKFIFIPEYLLLKTYQQFLYLFISRSIYNYVVKF